MLPLRTQQTTVIIFLYMLLTTQPTQPMLTDIPTSEASFSYTTIIACCASFCIGAALWACVHNYFFKQTTVTAQHTISNTPAAAHDTKNLFEPLYTDLSTIHSEQKNMLTIITQQQKNITNLTEQCTGLQLCICALADQSKKALHQTETTIHQHGQLIQSISENMSKTTDNSLPAMAALYWMRRSQMQSREPNSLTSAPHINQPDTQ